MPIITAEKSDEQTQLLKQKAQDPLPAETGPFDYEAFIVRMRDPSCRPVIVQVRKFLKDFATFGVGEQPQLLRRFHQRLWEKLMQTEAWRHCPAHEAVNAREGLEYLLMNQLYDTAYVPDQDASPQFARKLQAFDWLQPRHLQCDQDVPVLTGMICSRF